MLFRSVRDTMHLALWFFDNTGRPAPKDYKLATLCERFNIPIGDTHEALADVRLTIQLAAAITTRMQRVAA